jgi:hypothetical protein
VCIFVWLGIHARLPEIAMHRGWLTVLIVVLIASLVWCGLRLRRQTGFS